MTIAMRGGLVGTNDTPQEAVHTPPPPTLAATASSSSSSSSATPTTSNQTNQSPSDGLQNEVNGENDLPEGQEPDFPHVELGRLDEMINRPRWVVPVLPKGELEVLLEASIDLCKRGLDVRSEACQHFFRDGLTLSFTKILTDEAVSGWKFEIHRCIMKNCERLIELCVSKLILDWFPLLDLLAMVLNPNNKFHSYNGTRPSETVPLGSQIPDEELFARPPDARSPKGWLVDLINRFGQLGGFQILLDRFQSGPSLSVPVIAALIRPFGLCFELLTVHTIEKYFLPVVDVVPKFLDNLSDDELNKEAKNEAKNDALSAIIKSLKCLVSRVQNHEETAKSLEIFRLKMILRLLQISPFNGKMNALNEVNKLIASVSYNYSHRHSNIEDEEYLTAERMAEWIKENKVLQIVLRDNLHQPQYVEKLEKIIRFIIKEKMLTLEDLDSIWAAQAGKHEAIVKNVHDLLAKLAWDFSPEQLDHLFDCFQASWTNASKKQREKLLELIRRLAEDDKDGVMAHKVLSLLWSLAHSDDVPTEIMDQALSAHVKILDYSCSQDRDAQKTQWLDKCVEELKNDKWVLPALKQIREICCLYTEAPSNCNHAQRTPHTYYRHDIINRLQQQHSLVILVAENLTNYMDKARSIAKGNPDLDPHAIWPDSRYSHVQQVHERLYFLRFLLKDGQLWLCAPQAKQTWQCLAENAVFVTDREACFKWFSKLMGDEPDLDPEINKDFFENNILQLDPCLLTENGMKCFDRFFKAVNSKEGKLIIKRRAYQMDDLELIGQDYIWRVVLCSGEEIANKAIQLLKETYTNLSPRLHVNQLDIHEDFIQSCTDRLKAAFDTISVLDRDKDSVNRMRQETTRMVRVLKVLYEYVSECDGDFGEERSILPMARAYRGKHVALVVRFPNQGRQVEDLEIWTHTNETLASVRRQILNRVKVNNTNMKVDLIVNGEQLDQSDDKKLISQIPLRDKTLITAKLCQVNTNMPSSPDSSSDSSTGSPQHPFEGPNIEAENCLPGVLMAQHSLYSLFLFQLADLGSSLEIPQLRDGARAVLKIMPADVETERKLRTLCTEYSNLSEQSLAPSLESIFFASSPSQVLYNLEVTYALLMPALDPMSPEAFDLQYNFIRSGGVPCVLGMLTKNNFLSTADVPTKRAAYLVVLKICKLLLTVVAHAVVQHVVHNVTCQNESPLTKIAPSTHNHAVILQQALHHIPNPNADCMLRNIAGRLAQHLLDQAVGHLPDLATIRSIIRISWASSSGAMHLVHSSLEELHKVHEKLCQKPVNSEEQNGKFPETEDIQVCKEALEVLTLALALYPQGLETLTKEKTWQYFVIDLALICKNRSVRISAAEQFLLIATKCSSGQQPVLFFVTLLLTVLGTTVKDNAKNSHEYFQLLCRLLNYACASNCHLSAVENQLSSEILWLKKIRDNVLKTGDIQVEEALLEGHLGVTRELVCFLQAEVKHEIGSDDKKEIFLIKELMEDFLFPASKLMLQFQKSGEMPSEPAIPVCSTPQTVVATFDLLVALSSGCVPNLRLLAEMLTEIYNSEREQPLTEWEYLPPVGPRPHKGFVGLKNAGATCYMNSVLQQLYMIEKIRNDILSVDGAANDPNEDFSGEEKLENENNMESVEGDNFGDKKNSSVEESRKEYNLGVLKQIQAIFGHLACSKLQYYVPRGLWKHFKLGGEPVNLREQHDALEFFNSLVDSVDEALKALGHEQLLSKVLGGSFADQKICKGCPHRYSREESFTTLNIDIRNHSNLLDSLEQYVKGDLLEGANAYHCEKCSKKVDTVKRMCIKKLPPILAIQLKRFDYDWERECAVKFNDYFEFPRELDMGPYTVSGLAKLEREVISSDNGLTDGEDELLCTKYKLTGIVVHSGQASGGHYYSYILHRHTDGFYKWYKFDDGEVTECKMDDDEEIKNQCFGGEYMGEVFDHMLKRMSYRRQKRWWNAYILFYTRLDVEEDLLVKNIQDLAVGETKHTTPRMPAPIARSVCQQNIRFMHNRNQFSIEYFQFMKKLISCNAPYIVLSAGQEKLSPEGEELAMISIQLASNFLFRTGFHTKKTLRGSAIEWYEALCIHLRSSRNVRLWFANNVLFNHPHRFCEYLLECPTSEVRTAFVKNIVFLAHFSLHDGPYPPSLMPGTSQMIDPSATLSDYLLHMVLSLLKKEVSEHGRHLTQYFTLFLMYASLGVTERTQLLKLGVPATFMLVALDEGPGPPIKYQYAELGKLYQVVSQLIRCCDVSAKMQSSVNGKAALPNVHGDPDCPEYIMPIQPQVAEIIYGRPSYVKKIIEDANTADDTLKLLTFCSWENPHFSSMVLSELLWQIAYSYTYELRPYLDLLLRMLLLEDSWQNHRIHNALKGIPDDRDGLFDTIQRSKNHYQKRAYQCIKCMVMLFSTCTAASHMLHGNGDMKRKWAWAVEWLNGELERRPYSSNTPYAYNNWSPPTQSNETSNGYFLERSHSARMTLAKAIALCPEEEQEEQEMSEEGEGPQPDEGPKSATYNQSQETQQVPQSPQPQQQQQSTSQPPQLSSPQQQTFQQQQQQQSPSESQPSPSQTQPVQQQQQQSQQQEQQQQQQQQQMPRFNSDSFSSTSIPSTPSNNPREKDVEIEQLQQWQTTSSSQRMKLVVINCNVDDEVYGDDQEHSREHSVERLNKAKKL